MAEIFFFNFVFLGRALMLTAATGLLLDGPIKSINYNIEQIINSLSCMYNEMSLMACRFQVQFESILEEVKYVLEGKKIQCSKI
jgi:hypothetical protein